MVLVFAGRAAPTSVSYLRLYQVTFRSKVWTTQRVMAGGGEEKNVRWTNRSRTYSWELHS